MGKYILKEWKERNAMLAEQAKDYFYNKKQREANYWASGYRYGNEDCDLNAFAHFTDEEIAHIKELVVKVTNEVMKEVYDEPKSVSTMEEALKEFGWSDLFEESQELCELVRDRYERSELWPEDIDFETRHYFYKFSCLTYDYKDCKTRELLPIYVSLSDEDYIALLTLQLKNREGLTFNRVLRENPELGLRLNNQVEGGYYACMRPFTLLFDEIRADAEIIDGPMPAGEELYFENNDGHLFHVVANAGSHVLTVFEEDMKPNAFFADQRYLNDINAEKVMEILEVTDYAGLVAKLKEMFNTHSAFDDIKAWLKKEDVAFKENDYTK